MIISARGSRLWLTDPRDSWTVECDDEPTNNITDLFILDGELFLYGGKNDSHQQFAVNIGETDIHGHGNLKYFNNTRGPPGPSFATKVWALVTDTPYISFNGTRFLACQQSDGKYTAEVDFSNKDSGNGEGYISVDLWIDLVPEPTAYRYSE
ncbi:hypothetical protein B0J18DRAFT_455785 [Chaetomium sp. MPI-SDFR-AT-0129]|nr:hypothetical protein B0J18DRAFT_455785 [Chaetomium sp. MPI-SDFR-AT-0129]